MIECHFSIDAVVPFAAEATISFDARGAALGRAGKRLTNLLICEIGKPTQPPGYEQLHPSLTPIDIPYPSIYERRGGWGSGDSCNVVREVVEKEISTDSQSVPKVPSLVTKIVRDDLFGPEIC